MPGRVASSKRSGGWGPFSRPRPAAFGRGSRRCPSPAALPPQRPAACPDWCRLERHAAAPLPHRPAARSAPLQTCVRRPAAQSRCVGDSGSNSHARRDVHALRHTPAPSSPLLPPLLLHPRHAPRTRPADRPGERMHRAAPCSHVADGHAALPRGARRTRFPARLRPHRSLNRPQQRRHQVWRRGHLGRRAGVAQRDVGQQAQHLGFGGGGGVPGSAGDAPRQAEVCPAPPLLAPDAIGPDRRAPQLLKRVVWGAGIEARPNQPHGTETQRIPAAPTCSVTTGSSRYSSSTECSAGSARRVSSSSALHASALQSCRSAAKAALIAAGSRTCPTPGVMPSPAAGGGARSIFQGGIQTSRRPPFPVPVLTLRDKPVPCMPSLSCGITIAIPHYI